MLSGPGAAVRTLACIECKQLRRDRVGAVFVGRCCYATAGCVPVSMM